MKDVNTEGNLPDLGPRGLKRIISSRFRSLSRVNSFSYAKNRNLKIGVVLTLVLASLMLGLTVGQQGTAQAAPTRKIPFSATLRSVGSGFNVPDGNYTITFRIYTSASGGSAVWEETQSISVKSGILSANLGDSTAFPASLTFDGNTYYLGITVGSDEEMSPRKLIASVPSAFNADTVDGYSTTTTGAANSIAVTDSSGGLTLQGGLTVGSPILPSTNGTINLGSSTAKFGTIYANSISAGSTEISGTTSESFAINTDQATNNTEDAAVRFYLGPTLNTWSALQWSGSSNRFEFYSRVGSSTLGDARLANLTTTEAVSIGSSLVVTGNSQFDGGTITLGADTNFALSGGVNGASFDTTTLSIDATNDRVGIGTVAPESLLHVVNSTASGDVEVARFEAPNATGSGQDQYITVGTTTGSEGGYISWVAAENRFGLGRHGIQTAVNIVDTNVGIGDTSPASLFTVGSGDLFQVNSSGAIAAVTGITSSGAYTQTGSGANAFTGAATFGSTLGVSDLSTLEQLTVNGDSTSANTDITLGDATTDQIVINAAVASDFIPLTDNTFSLGASNKRWANFYAANAVFDTLTTPNTTANAFVINSDNATADGEDSTLEFERGSTSPNAIIGWNSSTDVLYANLHFQMLANTTFGDASGDAVTSNAATWTFANDTAVALSGGVDGLNFDSNTLSIDATNNRVGIGTAAPDYFLDVAGTFGVDGAVTLGDASGDTVTSTAGAWTFSNATTVTLANSATALNFDSNTLNIDANNNRVGIGTAAPGVALDVTGAATVSSAIISGSASSGARMQFSSSTAIFENINTGVLALRGNGSNILHSNTSLNVGIGEDGGNAQLAVLSGTGQIDDRPTFQVRGDSSGTTLAATDFPQIRVVNADTTANNFAYMTFADSATGAAASTDYSAAIGVKYTDHTNNYADLLLRTRSSDGAVDRVYITAAGSVGIGDTSPDYFLDVAGTLGVDGAVTLGDASGDSVTSNAATWTFANDTSVALSGGTNGLNFDSNTLSIDATNNRIGIGTASPSAALHVVAASGSASTGTAGDPGLTVVAGNGGSAPFDLSVPGGAGGAISLVGGDGGAWAAGTGQSGGAGGSVTITAGSGGDANSLLGNSTGAGGSVTINPGAAGSGTATSGGNGNIVLANLRGNVGIGDASPAALLTVGSGDLFQVNSSGLALHPLGAVGAPSVSFVSDTNTGLWSAGADTLNFSVGGSEAARIDSDKEFGVGTTNPTAALHVVGIANSDGALLIQGAGGSNAADLVTIGRSTGGGDASVAGSTDRIGLALAPTFTATGSSNNSINGIYINLNATASSAQTIDNAYALKVASVTTGGSATITNAYGLYVSSITGGSNNYGAYIANSVGINDTTPDYLLDVAGTFGTDGAVTLGDASGDSVTSNAATWTFANATGVSLASSTAALNFDSGTLVIDSTNNRVGIGITPTSLAPFRVQSADTGSGFERVSAFNKSNSAQSGILIEAADGAARVISDWRSTSSNIDLYLSSVNSAGTAQNQLVLQASSGNVGIGDATPSNLLTVGSGDLFQVNSSGAIAAVTGITTSGAYTQSGTSANTLTGATSFSGAVTLGDASGDSVTSNAATWTFANDTSVVLSGGVDGLNFDSNTLSIDASNNRVGIGTAAPSFDLEVAAASTPTLAVISSGSTGYSRITSRNDQGAAAYSDLITYGSSSASTLFGPSAANKTFLLTDGSSSAGLTIGTVSSDSLTFGTNNTVVGVFNTSGQLQVPTTGSSAGILLGGDALLYRSAADVLRTPDALTVDAALTASLGITVSGSTASLNASSNNATNINTGTSTGAVTIGGGSGTVAINSSDWDIDATGIITGVGAITADGLFTGTAGATISGAAISLNASSNFGTNINTGTSSGAVAIGGGSGTVAIDSSDWDITAAGVLTGVSGITTDGGYTQSGTTANTLTGATTLSASGTALSVTNNATIGGTLTVAAITSTSSLAVTSASNGNISVTPNGTGDIILTVSGNASQDVIIGDGGTSNYAKFDTSGALTFTGSARPYSEITLLPDDAVLPGSNNCARNQTNATNHSYFTLDCDAATDESVFWQFKMPQNYANGTNVQIDIYWEANATSGAAVFDTAYVGVADAENFDGASLTTVSGSADTTAGTAYYLNTATITATSPSIDANDIVSFKLVRNADHASDDLAVDAKVIKVRLRFLVGS